MPLTVSGHRVGREIIQHGKGGELDSAEAAFIGDDIIDIPVLKTAGFSVAVADALDIVKKTADYITQNKGGRGAVREICEMLLKAQGKWPEIAAKYEFADYL